MLVRQNNCSDQFHRGGAVFLEDVLLEYLSAVVATEHKAPLPLGGLCQETSQVSIIASFNCVWRAIRSLPYPTFFSEEPPHNFEYASQ